MSKKIANKQIICDKLIEHAKLNRDIVALTSDSRGSASMTEYANELPEQFVEVGIAEQNIIGMAAGLAAAGKIPFVTSYAAFLTMRSIEQIKVDVAYSNTNVKVIGISGGVSYGPLGMSHHSLQDIATLRAIPNIDIILPADRFETAKMIDILVQYDHPVYVRVGRNSVPNVHQSADFEFKIGKAIIMTEGSDLTIIATGETVHIAVKVADELNKSGISTRVLNMHTIKPLDQEAIIKAAEETGNIITIEEHSIYGGLGAAVSEVVTQNCCVPMKIIGIADEPAIAGTPAEVFKYYGLSPENIIKQAKKLLNL